MAKLRLPGLAATLRELAAAREAARLSVLCFLAEARRSRRRLLLFSERLQGPGRSGCAPLLPSQPALTAPPAALQSQSADLFLSSYASFGQLVSAVATLDVLAGFASATHPSAAPPGCAFSRPTFAAGGGGASAAAPAPPLLLRGLWNPALLASRAGASPVANDLALGGAGAHGLLLLTGPNAGGKSTLLRSAGLATVMAQVGRGGLPALALLAAELPLPSCCPQAVPRCHTLRAGHNTNAHP